MTQDADGRALLAAAGLDTTSVSISRPSRLQPSDTVLCSHADENRGRMYGYGITSKMETRRYLPSSEKKKKTPTLSVRSWRQYPGSIHHKPVMGLLSEGGANAAGGGKPAVLLFTVSRYFISVTCAFSTIFKKLEFNTCFKRGDLTL